MIQGLELPPYLIGGFFHGMGLFLDQVPLIDNQDQPFPFPDHLIYNGLILLAEAFHRVDQHQDHIGTINGILGPHRAVILDPVLHFGQFPKARGIHQGNIMAMPL